MKASTIPNDALEFYRYLNGARTLDELDKRIRKTVHSLGFSDFTYARLGQGELYANLASPDAELLEIYYREGLQRHDAVLQYSNENTRPIFLSSVHEYLFNAPFTTESIEKNRQIKNLIESFGYADFYTIPLHHHDGDNAMFAVTAKGVDRAELQRRVSTTDTALALLGEAVDCVGARRFPGFFLKGKHSAVNPRPLLLLTLIATENMTIAEAASRMGISLHTANKQMAAAKQALGATTQASAVYLALKSGLIEQRV